MSGDTIPIYKVLGVNTDYSNRRPQVQALGSLVTDISQRFDAVAPHMGAVLEIQSAHLISRVQEKTARSFAGRDSRLRCNGRGTYDRLGLLYDKSRFEVMILEDKVALNALNKLKDAKCLPLPLRDRQSGRRILFLGCHLPHRSSKEKQFCCKLIRDSIEDLRASFDAIIVCGDFNMTRPQITSSLGVSKDTVAFVGIDNVVVYKSGAVKYWGHETIRASDYYAHDPVAVKFAC